jgi:hypothetical protein
MLKTKIFGTALFLFAVNTAYAQVNLFNTLRSAQSFLQQAGSPVEGADRANNETTAIPATSGETEFGPPYGEYEVANLARTFGGVKFEDYFKCSPQPTTPLVSSISLRGITLGDVCGLPDETLATRYGANDFHGQLRGFLIRTSSDALAGVSAAAVTASGRTTMFDRANKPWAIGLFTSRAQPSGLARTVIATVQGTICAADPTNSLQPDNSFRAALEQKYGKPSAQLDSQEIAKKREQESNRAKQLYDTQSEAYRDAAAFDDMAYRNWSSSLPAGAILELDWRTPDGVKLLVTRIQDGCGNNPAFNMVLVPDNEVSAENRFLVRQWAEPMGAFQKKQIQARSATAPTPTF